MDTHRIRARDAAVRRLRVVTAALAGVAGGLALVSGVLAAKAFPGRTAHTSVKRPTRPKAVVAKPPTQSAPSLVSAGSQAQPQPPQAPAASPPAPAAAPPVAVSGGS